MNTSNGGKRNSGTTETLRCRSQSAHWSIVVCANSCFCSSVSGLDDRVDGLAIKVTPQRMPGCKFKSRLCGIFPRFPGLSKDSVAG